MNLAAALPVTQLTEDQAVEELARILDSAPDESDQLAFIHWKQAHAGRAQQLEAHILHCQKQAAQVEPEPNTQDAPPHHLQPEPNPGPGAPEENPMSDPIPTPDPVAERLAGLLARFNELAQQVPTARNSKACTKIRQSMHNAKFAIKSLCNRNGLPVPELQEVPPNPFSETFAPGAPISRESAPAPKGWDGQRAIETSPETVAFVEKHLPDLAASPLGRQVAEEVAERTGTLQEMVDLSEKAGPGPYLPPTAEDLRALLPPMAPAALAAAQAASLDQPMACGEDCVHPSHHHCSTADLDMRDRHPGFRIGEPYRELAQAFSDISYCRAKLEIQPPTASAAAEELARAIAARFWALCQEIEKLPNRQVLRPALDVIYARLQTVYALVDEVE